MATGDHNEDIWTCTRQWGDSRKTVKIGPPPITPATIIDAVQANDSGVSQRSSLKIGRKVRASMQLTLLHDGLQSGGDVSHCLHRTHHTALGPPRWAQA